MKESPIIARCAVAERRHRFVRTRRIKSFDDEIAPTPNERDSARAVLSEFIAAIREPAMIDAIRRRLEREDHPQLFTVVEWVLDAISCEVGLK